jgi:regulatory protein
VRITRITSDRTRRGTRTIYADGSFLTSISAEALIRSGLRVGDEISDKKVRFMHRVDTLLSAKNTALRFLSYRPRTEREVRDNLREKEFGDEEIGAVMEDLKKTGLLNDAEFARLYVRSTLSGRPVGKMILRKKMLLLGLDSPTVDAALEQTFADLNQEEMAMEAALKFVRRTGKLGSPMDRRKLRERVTGFLARRGFPWDVVHTVIRRLDDREQTRGEE